MPTCTHRFHCNPPVPTQSTAAHICAPAPTLHHRYPHAPPFPFPRPPLRHTFTHLPLPSSSTATHMRPSAPTLEPLRHTHVATISQTQLPLFHRCHPFTPLNHNLLSLPSGLSLSYNFCPLFPYSSFVATLSRPQYFLSFAQAPRAPLLPAPQVSLGVIVPVVVCIP